MSVFLNKKYLYLSNMAKENKIEHKKWEKTHEFDDCITIWRYDSKKSMFNPYEVEIKYKNVKKVTKKD